MYGTIGRHDNTLPKTIVKKIDFSKMLPYQIFFNYFPFINLRNIFKLINNNDNKFQKMYPIVILLL